MKWNARIAMSVAMVAVTAVGAHGQFAAPDVSKTANPELVGGLAKELGATPQQAEGAAGALFAAAKQNMPAADWTKVKRLPRRGWTTPQGRTDYERGGDPRALGAAPTAAGVMGGAATMGGAAGAFSKLGLKPDMVAKAVPILTQDASKTGGADVGALLAGAYEVTPSV